MFAAPFVLSRAPDEPGTLSSRTERRTGCPLLGAGGGVLEALGQAFGALGGLLREAGRHGASDRQELGLHARADAARASSHEVVQAADGSLEPAEGALIWSGLVLAHFQPVLGAPRLEVDDPSHVPNRRPRV
jgi:hypothetical protein